MHTVQIMFSILDVERNIHGFDEKRKCVEFLVLYTNCIHTLMK